MIRALKLRNLGVEMWLKNLEEEIANDGNDTERDPKVNLYLIKLIQMESEDEQK